MTPSNLPSQTAHRNQLIDDLLSAAQGEEVHLTDIAYFFQLDPFYVNYWMKKYNRGNWLQEKNQFRWKWQKSSSWRNQ